MPPWTQRLLLAVIVCIPSAEVLAQSNPIGAPSSVRRAASLLPPVAQSEPSASLRAPVRSRVVRGQYGDDPFPPPPPPAYGSGKDPGWGYREDRDIRTADIPPEPDEFDTETRPAARLGALPAVRPVSVFLPRSAAEAEAEERYNSGAIMPETGDMPPITNWYDPDEDRRDRTSFSPWDNLFILSPDPLAGRNKFESDHCFENFISPVTNPFLAEDPRTLTELRPIFMYQKIPDSNYLYNGGEIFFFGGQARLALTDRFSVVIHKLGGLNISPGAGSFLSSETSFAELWLGPKYNFWRDEFGKFLATGGLIFQIPTGPSGTYQDTGSLSLTPYATFAKQFWQTSWGSFNFMDTVGYSIGVDNQRSDYLYNSLQVNLDVHDKHRYFPLVELNWFHYTKDGSARPLLGFEGGDIANTGAAVSGRNYLTIAVGGRIKITQSIGFGAAVEFPVLGTKDLNDLRVTADFIWRY